MRNNMKQHKLDIQSGYEVSATVDLRILETTDLHVHLHPYDYYADRPNPDLGLSRLAELIDVARQEVRNTLLFDNGDFLQGTPVGDFFAYDRGMRNGEKHPVIAAMNALQYDAITLGNHEFNYGLEFLMHAINQTEFPVVAANILHHKAAHARSDSHLVRPYRLLQRKVCDRAGRHHPITIGVIGVAPSQITLWDRQSLNGMLHTRDMVDAVRAWVPEMREAGADLVVLLAHSGIGQIRHTEHMENAIIPLAGIDGVDLILSGHTHQLFPSRIFADIPGVDVEAGTICGKPTVMSGFFGSHLGMIDLQLVRAGSTWEVLDAQVRTRALRDASLSFATPKLEERTFVPLSPKVRMIVEEAHHSVIENIRQPIGESVTPINSFFAYLGRSAATEMVALAQMEFVRNHLAGTPYSDLPLLSSVAPCKTGGLGGPGNYTNIEQGELTLRSLADLYIFPNRMAAVKMTGAQVLMWLERAVSAFHHLRPDGIDQPLMNQAYPGYNFEILYGLEYEIDLTVPARFDPDGAEIDPYSGRIRSLKYQGEAVDMEAEFIICTNSFRAHGAGLFAPQGEVEIVFEHPAVTRDILQDYVKAKGPLDISVHSPFRIRSLEDASVVLQTGLSAMNHLDQIADFNPEILGADKRGFLRIRLEL